MNSLEIRNKFLSFFEKNRHEIVSSSSLIPAQDPTLLFANAGMNQFKDLFLGIENRSYKRAVSIQKCVRAGGKHNDLDNVGFTKRHLTFFEMMGNFSFGDYFKKDAINFAWEFLTKEIKLEKDLLHASVFETDDESYDMWHTQIGLPAERIHRLGAKDNFWQMGDIGPCGPCTEIYIDRGTLCTIGDNKKCAPGCDCDRFLEIWNLVFMQFERHTDGTLVPLQQTGVDTGMGLERLCAIVQNQQSLFTTDLFMPIIKRIETLTEREYATASDETKAAFHVLADHIRSSSLIIADGCAPTNEGRGYVLRKIIRRAALFTEKLTDKNIFPELSKTVVEHMGYIYPELITNAQLIYTILMSEIEKFSVNLLRGKLIFDRYKEETKQNHIITGLQAFKLYDTYGFPIEITVAAARDAGYDVDMDGFNNEMIKQQEQSGKKLADALTNLDIAQETEFTGYQELETSSTVTALIYEGQSVRSVSAGQMVYVIAEKSPFFIVGGGQVPDQGWIIVHNVRMPIKEVRFINKAIAAYVYAEVEMSVGDVMTSLVDRTWRENAMKNHTATHLLQAALIEIFGKQIQQSGSLVHPDYLRFDFTYHQQLNSEDIKKIEDCVNEKIRANILVSIKYCTLKEAQSHGALAFFGEKYKPENVRMVKVSDFSIELCGGTHVQATGDIGTFKITDSVALSAGHRRIVAVTGPKAIELFQDSFNVIKTMSSDFKVKREDVLDALHKQKDILKDAQLKIKQLRHQLIAAKIAEWKKSTDHIQDVPFLYIDFPDATSEELRMISTLLEKEQPGFYFVIGSHSNKALFFSILSACYASAISMKNFSLWLKDSYGLAGGGSGNTLQGGGGAAHIVDLKDAIKRWIGENIK